MKNTFAQRSASVTAGPGTPEGSYSDFHNISNLEKSIASHLGAREVHCDIDVDPEDNRQPTGVVIRVKVPGNQPTLNSSAMNHIQLMVTRHLFRPVYWEVGVDLHTKELVVNLSM